MAHTTPTVRDDTLVWQCDGITDTITVGTPRWFAWLANATTFAFSGAAGAFTARKERQRRGRWYWRAYAKRHGKLQRVYLGKTDALTLDRLRSAAAALAQRHTLVRRADADPAPSRHRATPGSYTGADLHHGRFITTKLAVPQPPPGLVTRPALAARLDRATQRTLTLVSAPAGFGKTTLLASWCMDRVRAAIPVAWLSLDAGDNDPLRFWAYVIKAFQTRYPGFAEPVLQTLVEPRPHAIDTLAAALINELADVPHDVTLVLDDYHVITELQIHRSVALFVSRLPQQAHVVLASRADPPFSLVRLRMRGELTEFRTEDLRFTNDEIATFIAATDCTLTAHDVEALAEITEGWIGGLHLAALSLTGQPHATRAIAALSGAQHHFVEYLAQEVLQQQPKPIQQFLLQTAILNRLNGPLCAAVTGYDDCDALLDTLYRANLFLVPLDERHTWYRYQHLFATFLRDTLQRTQPDAIARLHGAAARWFAAQGDIAEAITHTLAGAVYADAARLLVEHAALFFARGEITTLLRWIESLPENLVAANARLCLIHVQALMLNGQWNGVETRLQDVERRGNGDETEAEVAVLHGIMALLRGQIDEAAEVAARVQSTLADDDVLLHGMAALMLGAAAWAQGDLAATQRLLFDAQHNGLASHAPDAALLAMSHQAHFYTVQGKLHAAILRYEQVLASAKALRIPYGPALTMASLGLGRLLYEHNDLSQALQVVRQGIEQAQQIGNTDSVIMGYMVLARIAQAQGDTALARTMIEEAEQALRLEQGGSLAAFSVTIARAWLALAHGDAGSAAAWMHDYERHLAPHLISFNETAHLLMARIHIAQGRPEEALHLLTPLRTSAELTGRSGSAIAMLVVEALACQSSGTRSPALQNLERALARAAPEGYVRSFLDAGAALIPLLQHVADATPASYARTLLEAYQQAGGAAATALAWVEPLSEREREVLRLVANGASNQDIARMLVVTISTVKKHLSAIFQKLNVQSRTQAVAQARRLNLL
ncbi:MAG: LuxR C-terminal-related transcriptional regulator [Chloroflexales bacterium]|nr:LuxR C-terminal-related transcriptional regulator [Chloroflexales bacterium]